MAGGTSRKNHSEVGSSYVHFNFTPRQDKATASLIGDVPRGVMLDQPPIFLGGQGGLVGPARIGYGVTIPAGTICRQDVLGENQLFFPPPLPSGEPQKTIPGQYRSIDRIVTNNLIYIGNLQALKAWYTRVRKRYMSGDTFAQACWRGAIGRLETGIGERIQRLVELAEKMPHSLAIAEREQNLPRELCLQQEKFWRSWPAMQGLLAQGPSEKTGADKRDEFLTEWNRLEGTSYIEAVSSLPAAAKMAGTAWLQSIVDSATSLWSTR
jgi:hypothetical protein